MTSDGVTASSRSRAAVPGRGVRPRVLVVGGGFGGLETAFYLRMLVGDGAELTLVSASDHFFFKPNSIYVPFGADPEKLKIPLGKPARRRGIELVGDRATAVDAEAHTVETEGGRSLGYDFLVLASGAGMSPEEVPGLAEHANSMWTAEDMLELRVRFEGVVAEARAGRESRVVFLVPPNNKCSGPLYEIVLMLDSWLRKRGVRERVRIIWTTYEASFIQAFGPRLHDMVTQEFERRDIEGRTGVVVESAEADHVRYAGGATIGYDLLVSFPPYVAAQGYESLPQDDRGFLATDSETRRVSGRPEIFAVGDAADFPVKQAFLAFLQADAAAEQIAAEIQKRATPPGFDPVSMCIMEQFDKATFARVPLRLTGDAGHPIEVRPGFEHDYQVGSGKVWRLGKKLLATAVPGRFRLGLPFHGGRFWSAMELGLKGMSAAFAERGGPQAKLKV